ncbi:hypothetical protein [Phocaeicola sp.]|uniref:hypothetical protein n=1 Tax=Phocaeicola sp. TaxID=2773926 RepID=UPI003AB1986C
MEPIERIFDDVEKSLNANCYFAALSLALTIPDICGKAEYPTETKNGKRYKDWYDRYIGVYEIPPYNESVLEEYKMPYLSGEVVYSFRNSLLHQGTPNIDNKRIREEANRVDRFIIKIQQKNQYDSYGDSGSQSMDFKGKVIERTYTVNIRRLCLILCRTGKGYYKENRDKFSFFNCYIQDETDGECDEKDVQDCYKRKVVPVIHYRT